MPRVEHDFLGNREIPDDVYYGVQTLRAIENFPISGVLLAIHRAGSRCDAVSGGCRAETG